MDAKSLWRGLGRHRGSMMVAVSLTMVAALSLHRSNSALAAGATLVKGVPGNALRVALTGNVHPLAQPRYDAGAVPGTLQMLELKFVLQRSAAQESALEKLLSAQQTRGSTQYHQWLTPAQFGAQFGAGDEDLQTATTWLQAQGFTVTDASAGRGVLPFSGPAAQVEAAFQTPIHYFVVDGVKHVANTEDPQIPAALKPLVAGIRGLHDFRARSNPIVHMVATPDETTARGNFVAPADYAIIYDFVPLYQSGDCGAGVTVVVAAQSDISLAIPANYWNAYGVYQNQQLSSLAAAAATDPGRTGERPRPPRAAAAAVRSRCSISCSPACSCSCSGGAALVRACATLEALARNDPRQQIAPPKGPIGRAW